MHANVLWLLGIPYHKQEAFGKFGSIITINKLGYHVSPPYSKWTPVF